MARKLLCNFLTLTSPLLFVNAKNPVKMVVKLLEDLQKEIDQEERSQAKLWEKVECGCKKNIPALQTSIEESNSRQSELTASIQERIGSISSLKIEIQALEKDLGEFKSSLESALGVRNKESKTYEKETLLAKDNIAALDQAIPAIRQAMAGGEDTALIQTSMRKTVQPAILLLLQNGAFQTDNDREVARSYLETKSMTSSSGEILGILEQMRDTMKANLVESTKSEETALANFKTLVESKQNEINAAESEVTEQKSRFGKQKSEQAEGKEELSDVQDALKDSKSQLTDKQKECKDAEGTFQQGTEDREAEKKGILAAVEILSSDAADESFSNDNVQRAATSFLQMRTATKMTVGAALEVRDEIQQKSKKKFGELIGHCEKSITNLKEEQVTEDEQLKQCKTDIHENELTLKEEDGLFNQLNREEEQKTSEKAATQDELANLAKLTKELENAVAEASETRKEENAQYAQISSELQQAVGLLNKAAEKLRQTYNGGTPGSSNLSLTQQDDDSYSLLGLSSSSGHKEGADPAARKDKGNKVVNILQNLAHEIELDLTKMKTDEDNQATEYERFVKDSDKATSDRKDAETTKQVELAKVDTVLTQIRADVSRKSEKIAGFEKEGKILGGSCKFLIENHGERKTQRVQEVESLQRAIAILHGMKTPSL